MMIECKCDDRKCNLKQKRNNGKWKCECKKQIKHRAQEEDFARNPYAFVNVTKVERLENT